MGGEGISCLDLLGMEQNLTTDTGKWKRKRFVGLENRGAVKPYFLKTLLREGMGYGDKTPVRKWLYIWSRQKEP